mmetsp:Transcript_15838/g.45451  ORF Transcript_15838/g.45451 Transcript_15838/m.45451 type:complete len:226 (+) Transcript_15838:3362-4039(+)
MGDKDLLSYPGRQGYMLKNLEEEVENLIVILGLHLALEAVDAVHVLRFMIPPEKIYAFGVRYFKEKVGQDDLDGERSPINEVAIEQVRVVPGRVAVHLKDVDYIVKLAVRVATDCNTRSICVSSVMRSGGGWFRLGEGNLKEGGEGFEVSLARNEEAGYVALVNKLLVLEPLDCGQHEFPRKIPRLEQLFFLSQLPLSHGSHSSRGVRPVVSHVDAQRAGVEGVT